MAGTGTYPARGKRLGRIDRLLIWRRPWHDGHNGKHGGARLPDSLRWLWRDYPEMRALAYVGVRDY